MKNKSKHLSESRLRHLNDFPDDEGSMLGGSAESLRFAILGAMRKQGLTIADLCQRSERNGIEALKRATMYRIFNLKKPFSPRESTLRSLLNVLGNEFLDDYQTRIIRNFTEAEEWSQCANSLCVTNYPPLKVFLSQHIEKSFGSFRNYNEHNHSVEIALCSLCFDRHRETLTMPYTKLMKKLIQMYGKDSLVRLLNVHRTTIERVLKGNNGIKFLDSDICAEMHLLAIGESKNQTFDILDIYLQYVLEKDIDEEYLIDLFFYEKRSLGRKLAPFARDIILQENGHAERKLSQLNGPVSEGRYIIQGHIEDAQFRHISAITNRDGKNFISVTAEVRYRYDILDPKKPWDDRVEENIQSMIIESTSILGLSRLKFSLIELGERHNIYDHDSPVKVKIPETENKPHKKTDREYDELLDETDSKYSKFTYELLESIADEAAGIKVPPKTLSLTRTLRKK